MYLFFLQKISLNKLLFCAILHFDEKKHVCTKQLICSTFLETHLIWLSFYEKMRKCVNLVQNLTHYLF